MENSAAVRYLDIVPRVIGNPRYHTNLILLFVGEEMILNPVSPETSLHKIIATSTAKPVSWLRAFLPRSLLPSLRPVD